jgi:long-chain acyl-CoA synthetase
MLHPRQHAIATPDRICAVEAFSGRTQTYGMLEVRANRIAHLCRSLGVQPGGTIAFLMHDRIELLEIAWGAQRAGLYFLPVYWNLSNEEAAWMIGHADTQLLFYETRFAAMAMSVAETCPGVDLICVDGQGPEGLENRLADQPETPVHDEMRGLALQYTGGTSGRPKGVRRPIAGDPIDTPDILLPHCIDRFGFSSDMRFSTSAPMYHVAPLKLNMIVHALGGTTILLGEFDARTALAAIETYRITHGHWVPHMLVALVKLSPKVRGQHDLSSLRCAIHAAAPCAPAIKSALIEWWGPIVHEIYAGTEGVGFCMINAQEWLEKPGSVGRSVIANVRILRADGIEAAPGEIGEVWFENALPFAYHKDPDQTRRARNDRGWVTMDDLGFLDQDGFLYLRDRKSTTLMLDGNVIYPRVIEDALIGEPTVSDLGVAVVADGAGTDQLIVGYAPLGSTNHAHVASALAQAAMALPIGHRPHDYVPLSHFPRDADGKIDRALLSATLQQSHSAIATTNRRNS